MVEPSWIVCQLGAREHYALASALHGSGRLHNLFVDAWLPPHNLFSIVVGKILPRLRDRYAESLADASITGFTASLVAFELRAKLMGHRVDWGHMIARNEWFQEIALSGLEKEISFLLKKEKPVVFSYSYSGKRILEYAKKQGCTTVLGQIDPGPAEEDIVEQEVIRNPELKPRWQRVPPGYWEDWRDECSFADHIIVNSDWARQALVKVGIEEDKLSIAPLMYDSAITGQSHARQYPVEFTEQRPLRVLFLGSLIIRKGIAAALEAVRLLNSHPVEFWFVGSQGIELPRDLWGNKRLHWIGPVRRSQTSQYFRNCDIFLFPTLSDGFGLTQLEAMSHSLPVISSTRCGEVVIENESGLVLEDVGGEQIATALKYCLINPHLLAQWSGRALERIGAFSPVAVLPRILDVLC